MVVGQPAARKKNTISYLKHTKFNIDSKRF